MQVSKLTNRIDRTVFSLVLRMATCWNLMLQKSRLSLSTWRNKGEYSTGFLL